MQIAVIRRECGLNFGGAEAYCSYVAAGLAAKGHDVTVIADRSDVENTRFARAVMRGRGSIAKNISFFRSAELFLGQGGFDLTYGLSRVGPVDLLRISDPLHAAWLDLGYSGFRWLRYLMPRHRMLLMLEKKAICKAGRFVVNSGMVKKQIVSYYNVEPDRVDVLWNGVDRERFHPLSFRERMEIRGSLGIDSDDILFLFAGTDLKRKGFAPLADTFCRLCKERDMRGEKIPSLIVAGMSGHGFYEEMFAKNGVSDRVYWLGYRRDMEKLYAISDMFVLPTRYDPFANTTLEAISCGIPVLTTVFNGASEIYGSIYPWLVVKDVNSEALFNAMSIFLNMGMNKRDEMTKIFIGMADKLSWRHHVNKLEQILLKVAKVDGFVKTHQTKMAK